MLYGRGRPEFALNIYGLITAFTQFSKSRLIDALHVSRNEVLYICLNLSLVEIPVANTN